MTVKDDLIELVQELNALEREYGIPTNNAFHTKADAALGRHAALLGVEDDLDEIRNAGFMARGGTPKEQ